MNVLYLATTLALAAPTVSLEPAEVTPAPRFEADEVLHIQGDSSDIFAAADSVYVDAPIGDNAFLAGAEVHIDSAVHGDLFAAGETLYIDAPVHGDVYALGGEVLVGPNGRIDGHLRAAGGEFDIGGPVGGSVMVGAGRVVIGAPIGGDVMLEAGELVFRDGGHVGGDLLYTTPEATPGVDGAVDGAVSWTQSDAESIGVDIRLRSDEVEPGFLDSAVSWGFWTGWSLVTKLIVGGVLLLLGGGAAARVGRVLVEKPSQSLGFGVAVFWLLPMASLFACLTLIPLPLGLLGFLTFAALLYVSQLVAAQALGDEILRRFRPGAWGSPAVSMAVGLVPLVLLSSLPWVGPLVWFVATLLGGGAIWLWLRELARA